MVITEPLIIKEFINSLEKLNNKLKNIHTDSFYIFNLNRYYLNNDDDKGILQYEVKINENHLNKKVPSTLIKKLSNEDVNNYLLIDGKNYYLNFNIQFQVIGDQLYSFLKTYKKTIYEIKLLEKSFILFAKDTEDNIVSFSSIDEDLNIDEKDIIKDFNQNVIKFNLLKEDYNLLETQYLQKIFIYTNDKNETIISKETLEKNILVSFDLSFKQIPLTKEKDSEIAIEIFNSNNYPSLQLIKITNNISSLNLEVSSFIITTI